MEYFLFYCDIFKWHRYSVDIGFLPSDFLEYILVACCEYFE